jgi:coenzyme F420-0:L-glutamate ligase/coenzyme F420-1:gamma-L-glutamate ligase
MTEEYRPVADVIASRRSIRKFADEPVDPDVVRDLVALACKAPAPHHSKPWRFVHVASAEARNRLADAMGESWLNDLAAEERGVLEVQKLLARSRDQVLDAPALELPPDWQPAFLALLGYPGPAFEPPQRAEPDVGEYLVER